MDKVNLRKWNKPAIIVFKCGVKYKAIRGVLFCNKNI